MRAGATILCLLGLTLTGCTYSTKPPAATQPMVLEPEYEPASASALAFTPPVAQDEPALDLSRSGREAAAFAGYEDLVQTYIYVRTDDRFRADGTDSYERRSIQEKVGTLSR